MTLLADIYNDFMIARQYGEVHAVQCFEEIFLNHPKVDKVRDPMRLYCTDIGKCTRSVAYRLLSTVKDAETPEQQRNSQRMFDVAEYMEAMLTAAFLWRGDLIDSQTGVPYEGRRNWGGRVDLIVRLDGYRRIIEVKTHRGPASNYELPKVPHTHQASSYDIELHEDYELDAPPLLWYVSRDGSGEPNEYDVDPSAETGWLMDELEATRNAVGAAGESGLPDPCPKVLEFRSYNKQIVLEPDWNCRYCDYKGTCEPDTGKSVWAEIDKELQVMVPKRACYDLPLLVRFVEANADKMLHPLRAA